MPLVQWIMQNLSTPPGYGVSGGGTAEVKQTSFIFPSGSALTSGSSFYNTIGNIVSSGGVSLAGESLVSETPAHRKKIKYLPGDVVYDKCNKSWVVVSFEFSSSEQILNLSNNVAQKILFESEISNSPIYIFGDETCPVSTKSYPVFAGIKLKKFENKNVIEQKISETISKIASLTNEPLNNFPVYSGRRKVKK